MKIKKYDDFKISENLKYHLKEKLSLSECLFRTGSYAFNKLYCEVRELHNKGLVELNEFDTWLVKETLIGESAIYNGRRVNLDSPFYLSKEQRGKGNQKYGVYTKSDKDNVIMVKFGHKDHNAKIGNLEESKNFSKRHDCPSKKDKTTPGYWSCNLPKYHEALNLTEPAYKYW